MDLCPNICIGPKMVSLSRKWDMLGISSLVHNNVLID